MLTLLILLACSPPTAEDFSNAETCLRNTTEKLDLTPRGVICRGDPMGDRVWVYCTTYPEELNGKPFGISYRTRDGWCQQTSG